MTLTERCDFLLDAVNLEHATGVPDARWEHFQLDHLCDDGTFRIEDKSRQIAWSWLVAAEGVAEALLDERDSIYVSINQSEAKEKIRYARAVIDDADEALAAIANGDIPAVGAVVTAGVPRFVGRSRNTPASIKRIRVAECRIVNDFSGAAH